MKSAIKVDGSGRDEKVRGRWNGKGGRKVGVSENIFLKK